MLRMRVAGHISEKKRSQKSDGLAGWLLAGFRTFCGVRTTEQKQMRLLETLSLGGKRQLVLVECGEERYLVGGGLESVHTIVPVSRHSVISGIAENR